MRISPPETLPAGDHAQQGRFPAAGRADQHNKLAVGDLQIDTVRMRSDPILLDVLQRDGSIDYPLTAPAVRPLTR